MVHEAILKHQLAERWLNPVYRIEDIFRVRTPLGHLIPLKVPEPQKQMLREGPLGSGRKIIDKGLRGITVLNKARQIGISTISAVEAILMAEDFPNTKIYYIADDFDQAADFMDKITQLCKDANHYPEELGGGPILNVQELDKTFTKKINNTEIVGLTGRNPKRGKSGVEVIWDEVAWCISRKNEQQEIWDVIQYYLRQGGWLRMQSTPRTTDDMFWKYYNNPEEHGMRSYYCPAIENWKELDLNQPFYIDLDNKNRAAKQLPLLEEGAIQNLITTYSSNPKFVVDLESMEIRQKNIQISYPWVKVEELEKQRSPDLEWFMQENLGVSVEEKYKLIPSEWIYRNVTDDAEYDERGRSPNPFYILVDLAQENDITAITIVEKLPDDTIVERRLDSSQEAYDVQVERIWSHYHNFKPQYISIDNTGHGRVIGDLLEKKLRMSGLPTSILHRVDFTSSSKEVMAVGFRRLVQADKYKFLNQSELHRESIRHVERVEKEVLETNVRYSGKRWGRDDFFWSKAQCVYFTNLLMPPMPAQFGKFKVEPLGAEIGFKPPLSRIEEIKEEVSKPLTVREICRIKAIAKCISELSIGVVSCPKVGEARLPLFCCGCERKDCIEYSYIEQVCKLAGVEPEVVWSKQKKYEKEE